MIISGLDSGLSGKQYNISNPYYILMNGNGTQILRLDQYLIDRGRVQADGQGRQSGGGFYRGCMDIRGCHLVDTGNSSFCKTCSNA